jgi:hypothetical protein
MSERNKMSTTECDLGAIDVGHRENSTTLPLLDRVERVLTSPNFKAGKTSRNGSVIVLVGYDDLLTMSREQILQSAGFSVISRTAAEELMLNPLQARDLTILSETVDTRAAEVILARVCGAGFATVAQILDPWATVGHTKMCAVILSSELTSPGKLITEVRSILAHYQNQRF